MQIPVSISRNTDVPIHEQLETNIRELIVRGDIPSDIKMPATRALKKQLQVSRNTVKTAYMNLISQGYLVTKSTSGTFVCTQLPDAKYMNLKSDSKLSCEVIEDESHSLRPSLLPGMGDSQKKSYTFGLSGIDESIVPERIWRKLLLKHLPYRSRHARYVDEFGLDILREVIASDLAPLRAMSLQPDNIIIVNDEYRAFNLVNHAILKPGDYVAVENPCDRGVVFDLERLGVNILPIPVDKNGIVVDKIPDKPVSLIYVSPSHQIPMGTKLSLKRRYRLLEWADKVDAYIVENDTFGEFCYSGNLVKPLKALDTSNRVVYVNSFSKWIGSAAKMGFLAVPYEIKHKFQGAISYLNPGPAWIDQRTAADFISSQSLFGHLRRIHQTMIDRQSAITQAITRCFGEQKLTGYKGGQHLVWHFPSEFPDASELVTSAREYNIFYWSLQNEFFFSSRSKRKPALDRCLVIGYSGLPDESIKHSIEMLERTCLRDFSINIV